MRIDLARLTRFFRLCGILVLSFFSLGGCPPTPPPPITVVGVTIKFTTSFSTLPSGTPGPVVLTATEALSNKTTRPGANREINFEVFPNTAGVFYMHGSSILINKPMYTALTGGAGTISALSVKCDSANRQVQVRAADVASNAMDQFEFTCTP